MTRARGWNDAGSGVVTRRNARRVRFCGFGARRDAGRGGFSSLAHLGFRVAVDGVYEQKVGRSPSRPLATSSRGATSVKASIILGAS